jgi:hypothetical protein
MKKRGRRRIRSAEYWRAYYRLKQREWRAAHPRAAHPRARRDMDISLQSLEEALLIRRQIGTLKTRLASLLGTALSRSE